MARLTQAHLVATMRRRRREGQLPVVVRVPATSANLGPGFDSLGIALSLFDEVEARFVTRPGVVVQAFGEGAETVPADETNLVARTIREGLMAFDDTGELANRGLAVTCRNELPHGRGLGSSAAAIVAGLLAAANLAGVESEVTPAALIAMASHIEGHADNVAAAVLGGATISWLAAGPDDLGPVGCATRFEVSPEIVPVLVIPTVQTGTAKARAALPTQVPHVDAAYNAARSALLVHALRGDPRLLLEATSDRLHQEQRCGLYPDSLDLVHRLRERGIPAAISGAGPSVVAFAADGSGAELADLIADWVGGLAAVRALPITPVGAHAL